MAHFKCLPCMARVWREDVAGAREAACPACGGPVEPVGDLTELVGLRALATRPARPRGAPNAPASMAAAILEAIARLDAHPPSVMPAIGDESRGPPR